MSRISKESSIGVGGLDIVSLSDKTRQVCRIFLQTDSRTLQSETKLLTWMKRRRKNIKYTITKVDVCRDTSLVHRGFDDGSIRFATKKTVSIHSHIQQDKYSSVRVILRARKRERKYSPTLRIREETKYGPLRILGLDFSHQLVRGIAGFRFLCS